MNGRECISIPICITFTNILSILRSSVHFIDGDILEGLTRLFSEEKIKEVIQREPSSKDKENLPQEEGQEKPSNRTQEPIQRTLTESTIPLSAALSFLGLALPKHKLVRNHNHNHIHTHNTNNNNTNDNSNSTTNDASNILNHTDQTNDKGDIEKVKEQEQEQDTEQEKEKEKEENPTDREKDSPEHPNEGQGEERIADTTSRNDRALSTDGQDPLKATTLTPPTKDIINGNLKDGQGGNNNNNNIIAACNSVEGTPVIDIACLGRIIEVSKKALEDLEEKLEEKQVNRYTRLSFNPHIFYNPLIPFVLLLLFFSSNN